MRILIVEDDRALREMLVRRLQREGYAVDASGDGIEGLEYALSAAYDAILLDIMLPGMDGLSVLSALRARDYAGGILLLTARDAVADRVRGLDAGADDYLIKPFSCDELSARLRALLRKHTPSRSPVLREGGIGTGHRDACRPSQRQAGGADRQGVCVAGIHASKRRAGAHGRTDV